MDRNALWTSLDGIWTVLVNAGTELVQPWRLYQVGILIACFLIATLLSRVIDQRARARLRDAEGITVARLRIVAVVLRWLRPIIFVLLVWLIVAVMREITWPSRSYLLSLVATIVTAWTVIAFVSRLIRNVLIRTLVRWGAWVFATLYIVGFLPEALAFLDGAALTVGEQRLSLLLVLKVAAILGILIALAGWASRLADTRIAAATEVSPSVRVLAEKAVRLLFYGVAIIVGMQSVGFDLTSLTVLSGAIGLGLGFGLQKVVSNLVSGIILLLDKSIKPGDVISLGETFGWITTLGARYVSVVTRDGREYLIPNEDLITGQVVNWSHSSDLVRLDIYFGVSYEADPHEVRRIASAAAAGVDRVQGDPKPVCHIVGFGDSSVDFILRFWIRDPTMGLTNIRGNVYLALWDALKAAEIEIPFPRRDVTITNLPDGDLEKPEGVNR